MRLKEFVLRYISIHKCGGCGEILDYEHTTVALCERCATRWSMALVADCGSCFKPMYKCTCMTKRMSEAGALCHRRLFAYKKDNVGAPEMRMIYVNKYFKLLRVTKFIAEQLIPSIKEECAVLSDNAEDFIIVSVPRSKRSYRAYGYDQSEFLAAQISKLLGIEYRRMFKSSIFAKQQKQLSAKERMKNAQRSIHLRGKSDASGKYVILVDDVVTTGAQMSVCTKLLQGIGARGVLCFSVSSENKM